jgi:hypothetical protein
MVAVYVATSKSKHQKEKFVKNVSSVFVYPAFKSDTLLFQMGQDDAGKTKPLPFGSRRFHFLQTSVIGTS